jgi:hypothetical protein
LMVMVDSEKLDGISGQSPRVSSPIYILMPLPKHCCASYMNPRPT